MGIYKSRIHIIRSFLFLCLLLLVSTSGYTQKYKTSTAKAGEGVYALLIRNGLTPAEHLADFLELNKAKLGKDNSLFADREYYLPVLVEKEDVEADEDKDVDRSVSYEIFGEKYKNVTEIDQKLTGAVYYLVSGHGGPDPGAVGKYGEHVLCEDEYAYDVTLRLARELLQHGAKVYMIIRDNNDGIRDESFLPLDKDEVCYPDLKIPTSQNSRLKQRVKAVNKLYSQHKGQHQRMIVVHVDSRSKGENIDAFFYYFKRSKTGRKTALSLQETFKAKYDKHQPNRGYKGTVSSRNLYVLHYSYPTAVFIELGNINHFKDQQRFIRKNNRQALANWLCQGLIKDFDNNKK